MKIINLGRKTIFYQSVFQTRFEISPDLVQTEIMPKEYVCGHRHKKIEMISVKKAIVSNEQKLRLDLKLCEHNKRFKPSHPVPRQLYLALLPYAENLIAHEYRTEKKTRPLVASSSSLAVSESNHLHYNNMLVNYIYPALFPLLCYGLHLVNSNLTVNSKASPFESITAV